MEKIRRDLFQSMPSSSLGFLLIFFFFFFVNSLVKTIIPAAKNQIKRRVNARLHTSDNVSPEKWVRWTCGGAAVVKLENVFIIWTDIVLFLSTFVVAGLHSCRYTYVAMLAATIDVALDWYFLNGAAAGILKCNRISCLLHLP